VFPVMAHPPRRLLRVRLYRAAVRAPARCETFEGARLLTVPRRGAGGAHVNPDSTSAGLAVVPKMRVTQELVKVTSGHNDQAGESWEFAGQVVFLAGRAN
jgi:hypothetical protein